MRATIMATTRSRSEPGGGIGSAAGQCDEPCESSGDVAVGSGALNLERVGRGDEGLAFEEATQSVYLVGGPSRKVGERALDDTTVDTEDSRRRMAGGDWRLGTDSTYMGKQYHKTTLIEERNTYYMVHKRP